MTEIYTIEYNNGEAYEDYHSYIDSRYYKTYEEAVKLLNFNNYHTENGKTYNHKFSSNGAKIVKLLELEEDYYKIAPFDKIKYEECGLSIKEYSQVGRQYKITFDEIQIDGVKVKSFVAYSEEEEQNLVAFPLVKEYLARLKQDLKARDHHEIIYDSIVFDKSYEYGDKEWLIELKLINNNTKEIEEETVLDIAHHFDEEEYQYQIDYIKRLFQ